MPGIAKKESAVSAKGPPFKPRSVERDHPTQKSIITFIQKRQLGPDVGALVLLKSTLTQIRLMTGNIAHEKITVLFCRVAPGRLAPK